MSSDPRHKVRRTQTSARRSSSALGHAKEIVKIAAEADGEGVALDLNDAQVIAQYTHMVHAICNKIQRRWSISKRHSEDMVGYAHLGLVEAYHRFNGEHNTSFSTFAYYRIKGSVIDGLRKDGVIRRRQKVQRAMAMTATSIREDSLEGPTPTSSGIIGHVDETIKKMGIAWLLINQTIVDSEASTARNSPARAAIGNEGRVALKEAMVELSEMEQAVIRGIYFDELSMAEIARNLGYSRSWVSRVHNRALAQLAEVINRPKTPP